MIKNMPGVVSVVADMEREAGIFDYEIEAKEGVDLRRELFKRVVARNWTILGLKTTEMTLEDIFLKITMGDDVVINTKKNDTEAKAEAVDAKAEEYDAKAEAADSKAEEYDNLAEKADAIDSKEGEE